jgi:acylphosphatase
MPINPLGMNQGTNSFIRFEDDGGTINTQVIDLRQGTVTLSNPTGTTVQFNNGTIDLIRAGTITTLPNIPGGTLGVVSNLANGSVKVTSGTVNTGTINTGTINTGTINAGTVDVLTLPNLPGGTLGLVSSIANLVKGTITKVEGGTVGEVTLVPTVTTVSNLTNGSVRVTVGTTVAGTLDLVTTVSNLSNGSVRVTVGTMAAGTVNTGTINAGTINTGTINVATATLQPYPAAQVLSTGTTTSGTIGTLVAAAGAGTGIYINAFSLNALSGTPEIILSYALQAAGNQVVNRGAYVPGAGITESYPYPSYFGTANAALTWNVVAGAGTVSYMVNYTTKGTP